MNKKIQLQIPAELSSVPLQDYQAYMKIMDANKDAEDSEFANMKMLEIFCKVDIRDVYLLPLAKFSEVLNHIINIFKEETPLQRDFTLTDPKGDSITFGFIPKLDDISLGEFIDLDQYINDWQQMHKAMAVLYRPITLKKGDLYLIEEYESSDKYSELMKDAPVSVALGATVFFYRLGKTLSLYLMDYLKKEVPRDPTVLERLQKNGVSINQYMQSLEEILQSLEKLPNSRLRNVSRG